MRAIFQDARFALRMLKKSPGFTAVAVIALAFGIGANTAMFSFVNAWVLHPLPYPQSDRLVMLVEQNRKTGGTGNVVEAGNFYEYQREAEDLESLTVICPAEFNVTGGGKPEVVLGARVGWNFFDVLGTKPEIGRTFQPKEDQPGAAHVAIVSRGLWQTRFAADPNILSRTIEIGGETYSIVGVMPAKFQLPLTGEANIWVPLALKQNERADRKNSWLFAIGRLRRGATLAQAQGEISGIAAQLEKAYPVDNADTGMLVHTLDFEIGAEQGNQEVMILFWIVALVLLIACANVANLMLARATGRTRELAMRTALGAGRLRLIRQLVTETVILFLAGSAVGVGVAFWTLAFIEDSLPERIRGYLVNYGHVNLDFQTLLYTFLIACVTGILFGLAPAISSTRLDVHSMLKESAGQAGGNRRGSRLRAAFVVAEIALAVIIVVCSSLLARSFLGLIHANPGFQTDNVLVAETRLPEAKYKTPADIRNFYDQVMERVSALPQVEAAGASQFVPFAECCSTMEVLAPDKPAPSPGQIPGANFSAITPGYFSAMHIELLKGRTFTDADSTTAPPAAIVNQTLANYFWPGEDPIGRKLKFTMDHAVVATIVGVVGDVKLYNSTSGKHNREFYMPFAQFPSNLMGIVVRSKADRAMLADGIRSAIWAVDTDQPVVSLRPLQSFVDDQYAGFTICTQLMAFFSALALFLGAIGIYAVMAFNVLQRTREIGIRMALGANPGQVLNLVLRDAIRLAALGIVIGVAGAFAASGLIGTLLYGVGAHDPVMFGGVSALIAVVVLAASYIPARRAMRVDPMVALRYE
ncbi:MAG TPA: ABC transporter permease [Candidatus Acidoferrales bacterium]|nr:ABC transporter permease [Candidatus Acidoferrales bacterium]